MNITEIVRRSSLIMPVNQPRFVDKAYLRGADAIVLDLEDSVPPAEKGRARTMVKEAIPVAARGGADVFVRINKPVEMMIEDLEAAIHPGLAGLALPKVESAAEIHMLDELTTYWEKRHGVPQGTVGYEEVVGSPEFATATGLLCYANRHGGGLGGTGIGRGQILEKVTGTMRRWVAEFF
jgi:citrate lyase subunit beta/citryl-CoA lyase